MKNNFYVPPEGPPPTKRPSTEVYSIMGEENIFRMLKDFYIRLSQSEISWMFPKEPENLQAASEKAAIFFIGFLGGPSLYHHRYGNPMMRARHFRFPINERSREVWLNCFDQTLDNAEEKYNFPEEHLEDFRVFLHVFSTWMVNKRP